MHCAIKNVQFHIHFFFDGRKLMGTYGLETQSRFITREDENGRYL